MTTNDLKTTRFANTADINTFFKQLEASSFVDWFTKYHADKDSFKNFKLTNESDFTKTFNDPVSLLENEDKKLGLYEFLTIFALTLINTKSTFKTSIRYFDDAYVDTIQYVSCKIIRLISFSS